MHAYCNWDGCAQEILLYTMLLIINVIFLHTVHHPAISAHVCIQILFVQSAAAAY